MTTQVAEKSLAQQLLQELSGFVPDDGPILLCRDSDGTYHALDPARFNPETWTEPLEALHDRICDGWEPATAACQGGFVTAVEVGHGADETATVFVILEGYSQDTAVANMGLIETLLAQIHAMAALVLRTRQMERFLRFGRRGDQPATIDRAG